MAEDYNKLFKALAGNAIKAITGDPAIEAVDDRDYLSPSGAQAFAGEAAAAVASRDGGAHAALEDTMLRYGAYRSAVNGWSFRRGQLSRAAKVAGALNTLEAIRRDGGLADIIIPGGE